MKGLFAKHFLRFGVFMEIKHKNNLSKIFVKE